MKENVVTPDVDNTPKIMLEVNDIVKHFLVKRNIFRKDKVVHAIDGVSLNVNQGETLGLVGESGSGKTTLGRCILRLVEPTSGNVHLDGVDILKLKQRDLRVTRRKMQMVFQDPADSLNPRFTTWRMLLDAYNHAGLSNKKEILERSVDLLHQVGMAASDLEKFPHQFSGGQQQRIAIARALVFEPVLLLLDEPTASLDVSVKSQVMLLLKKLKDEFDMSYILITHDLSTVKYSADKLAVMYLGKLVEMGDARAIIADPQHPYTIELIDAVPIPEPGRKHIRPVLAGEVPSPVNPPSGCRFHTRCSRKLDVCSIEVPEMKKIGENHFSACHLL